MPETLSYSSKTVFSNISQLTQGRLIKINLNDNKNKDFRWDYPLHNLPKIHSSYKENTKNYFDLLYTSTKLRLNSDVKIGTSLSGGIDSSTSSAIINQIKTPDFFMGQSSQFVSGSNGNIEISSSKFHMTREGNITASSFELQGGVIRDGVTIEGDLSANSIATPSGGP